MKFEVGQEVKVACLNPWAAAERQPSVGLQGTVVKRDTDEDDYVFYLVDFHKEYPWSHNGFPY